MHARVSSARKLKGWGSEGVKTGKYSVCRRCVSASSQTVVAVKRLNCPEVPEIVSKITPNLGLVL